MDVKGKIISTLLNSYNAMPSWLKNTLIVALILGFFYFGYARKEIIYSEEKETTEEIYSRIGILNKKIEKVEDIRIANEDMIYNIEEVRGIVTELSELHADHTYIIASYLKNILSNEDYRRLLNELDKEDKEYKEEVNELFNKKTKDHIKTSKTSVEEKDRDE